MSRGPRIDYPGLLHHVIFRGLNRIPIFHHDSDRANLLARLKKILPESNASLFAWVFMHNHVHLLIKTSDVRLGTIMQRVLTGYALYFNRKYNRSGYLFQGRFKSTVCDEESYLLQLVRYIHLNPLRAGIVTSLNDLASFPWSGHHFLLSKKHLPIQDTREILARFGNKYAYRDFIKDGTNENIDLEGGGLMRSLGGAGRAALADTPQCYDQRILGDEYFIESVWKMLEKQGKQTPRISFDELATRVCDFYDMEIKKVVKWKGLKGSGDAKAILVNLAIGSLGLTGAVTALKMNLSAQRISQLKYYGQRLLKQHQLEPMAILKPS